MSSEALALENGFNQAHALQQAGDFAAAEALYRQILTLAPRSAAIYINLAAIETARGNLLAAESLQKQALAVEPREPMSHAAYANTLSTLGRYEMALTHYDKAIALGLDHAPTHNNRGNVLATLKRRQEALASYERACGLSPNDAVFITNRGAMRYHFKRYAEALTDYEQALKLAPHYAEAWINRGTLLGDLGRQEEALASYDQALAFNPNLGEAQWNKALHLLRQGNFSEGWPLYESRWQKPEFKANLRSGPEPLWLGQEPLAGKTILLHAEQGMGDVVQFCRYVPMLEAQGAKVVLEVQPALVALVSSVSPTACVIAHGEPLPPFDYHCPLLSLPLALRTTLSTLPNAVPYLRVDAQKRAAWAPLLGAKTKPRVGLVWSGAAGHVNDHNRSIALDQLLPLLDVPVEFHAVQKEIRPSDKRASRRLKLHHHELRDFADTAALIEAMDLLITVDTSAVHVAGALGKPAWLLLPYVADFRWLTERSDSPWYPSLTLFRQPKPDDWTSVIDTVQQRLTTYLQELA